ncbi:hypothetical protein GOODEAATRI_017363 [Goodea atripinnis]|uniref:Uncharacterized protein n=1 Tax=Goodea atripinnis TaxID=208336 RepID=A0ABV0NB86_9TELE
MDGAKYGAILEENLLEAKSCFSLLVCIFGFLFCSSYILFSLHLSAIAISFIRSTCIMQSVFFVSPAPCSIYTPSFCLLIVETSLLFVVCVFVHSCLHPRVIFVCLK